MTRPIEHRGGAFRWLKAGQNFKNRNVPSEHKTLEEPVSLRQFDPPPKAREPSNANYLTRWCACCPTTISHQNKKQRFCGPCRETRDDQSNRRHSAKLGQAKKLSRPLLEEIKGHEEKIQKALRFLRRANKYQQVENSPQIEQTTKDENKARDARKAAIEQIAESLAEIHRIIWAADEDHNGQLLYVQTAKRSHP